MKRKIESLQPNECIHITNKKEAKRIAKLCLRITNMPIYMVYDFFSDSNNYLPYDLRFNEAGGLLRQSDMGLKRIPASDFLKTKKSKLKERVKVLEDKVNYLSNPTQTNDLIQLPEKWFITITEENRELVRNWFNDFDCWYYIGAAYGSHNKEKISKTEPKDLIDKGYTEISLSDFKRFVLKEPIELEVGKWYKLDHCLFNYQEADHVYGFFKGKWLDCDWSWPDSRGVIEATEQEVKEALIKEAERSNSCLIKSLIKLIK